MLHKKNIERQNWRCHRSGIFHMRISQKIFRSDILLVIFSFFWQALTHQSKTNPLTPQSSALARHLIIRENSVPSTIIFCHFFVATAQASQAQEQTVSNKTVTWKDTAQFEVVRRYKIQRRKTHVKQQKYAYSADVGQQTFKERSRKDNRNLLSTALDKPHKWNENAISSKGRTLTTPNVGAGNLSQIAQIVPFHFQIKNLRFSGVFVFIIGRFLAILGARNQMVIQQHLKMKQIGLQLRQNVFY